jgi:hypothetical protein
MFIYLVRGTVAETDAFSDVYDRFVCVASSADDARRMYPGGAHVQWSDAHDRWVVADAYHEIREWDPHIGTLVVQLLGRAEPDMGVGVVCASYIGG